MVGAGVGGLVLAWELARAGRRVVVLESSERAGGQLARQTVAGLELDAAAESFATRGGTVAALVDDLGLTDDVITPADTPAWLRRADGSSVPLPATSILGIPGVPMATDVIGAIGGRAAFRAQLDSLLPAPVAAKSATLGELVRRRMGDAVVEGLVAPVVRGVHSMHPDELPIARAHPRLLAALQHEGSLARAVRSLRASAPAGSQVAGLRGGVHRIVDALVAEIERFGGEVRTGVHVTSVEPLDPDAESPGSAGFDARNATEVGNSRLTTEAGERFEGRVVLATPALLPAEARPDSRAITLVTLVVDAPALDAAPRGTGVLVAAEAPGVVARALTHATAKWTWLAEAAAASAPGRHRHVLRLSYDERPADPVAQALADASALTGVPLSEPVGIAVATWNRASRAVHAVDGMHLVGEAGSGTGLAAVVAGAREQAGRLLGSSGGDSTPA
ncbi:FAD-binding protein [Schumannella soli]|uniref:FAD-binding protein n=1 Tax=Schumannella soli TaxID=2590779 RepID=A0A506Y9P2_9MICO|nr:FAD-binding protein [Schumannella soli]